MLECNGKYQSMESGRLWVHQDYAPAFRELGWTTTKDLIEASFSGELGRRRDYRFRRGWDNVRLSLATTPQPVPCSLLYLKRHRDHWHWSDPAVREARLGAMLDAAGVPCMKVVACGRAEAPVAGAGGRSYTSLFISESVGEGVPVGRAARQAVARGDQGRAEVLSLIESVARTAGQMHANHVYHGDCHLGNFIVDRDASGEMRARVIDLQSSRRIAPGLAIRVWLQDMCLLRSWWIRLGVGLDLQDYWYECYCRYADARHLRRWMACGARKMISIRGDLTFLRRGLSRFQRLQFSRGREVLRERYFPV